MTIILVQKQNIMSGQETKRGSIIEWLKTLAVPQSAMCLGNLRFTCLQLSGTRGAHSASWRENRKYGKACSRRRNQAVGCPSPAKKKDRTLPKVHIVDDIFAGRHTCTSAMTCTWSPTQMSLHVVSTVQHSVASVNTSRLLMLKKKK